MKIYVNQTTILLLILFTGLVGSINAQENKQPINLEIVLKLGKANNLTIQEYNERQTMTLADLSKAREWWLPDIYAGT